MKALIISIVAALIAGCSAIKMPDATANAGQRNDMSYRGGP